MNAKINKTLNVPHPAEAVWNLITDPYKIVACVPGASLVSRESETEYTGQVEFKVGPVKAKYDGKVSFLSIDAQAKKMSLKGMGLDSKGKGSAEMTMDMSLQPIETGTEVQLVMDINVTGMMAQFGSRLINDVSSNLLDQFGANLKAKLSGGEVDSDIHTGSIMGSVVKGLFGKS